MMRQANSARFFAPSGKSVRLKRDDEVAYIVDRPALDLELVSRAQSNNAEYSFSTHVTNIEFENNHVRIRANGNGKSGDFKGETAIIATGYGSDLPRNLNLGKISDFIIGAQAEVEINKVDEVEIYLDHKLAPGGFAWLVPTTNGKGLAGLMTRHQQEYHLNQLLSNLKAKGKIVSTEFNYNYGVIPLRTLPKTYAERILVVGESAGQVKPTTGGGIYYGIVCGEIAVDILNHAFMTNNFAASNLSLYQKQWQTRLKRELIIGYWAHRLWSKLSNNQIEYLFNITNKKGITELIDSSEDFSFDWHSRLIPKMLRFVLPFTKQKN